MNIGKRIAMAAHCALLAWPAYSHEIWVEQEGEHATLYYGEYGENLKETSPGELDKFPAPKVMLKSAGGDTPLASSKTADGYALSGRASAGEDLVVEIDDYPVTEWGEPPTRNKWIPAAHWIADFKSRPPAHTLDIVPNGTLGNFTLCFKGQPLPDAEIKLFAPSGWCKIAWTDAQGNFTVTPLWRGTYVINAEHEVKTPGESHGEKFEAAFYTSTLTFVNPKGPKATRPAPPAQLP